MTASYRRDNDVAVITIENPPVNGLSYAVRRDIAAGLRRAEADPEVRAIVLRGNDRGFSGGADIREFGRPEALIQPNVWSLIDAVERSPKPVVAAIHSVCMGGGFELALGLPLPCGRARMRRRVPRDHSRNPARCRWNATTAACPRCRIRLERDAFGEDRAE